MKALKATHSRRRWLSAGMAALTLAGVVSLPAQADMMLLGSTTLVTGTESATYSFTTPNAGTVTAELTNLDWPVTLSGLSFMASSANQVLSSWSDPGQSSATTTQTLTFQVPQGGTYFANVTATPGGPLDIGVYSFSLHFNNGTSAVPLPASGWLLAAGVIVLLGMWRSWRGRRTSDMLPQHAAH
ncbi:MAG TPA: hypothetical protein VKB72_03065 [Steroidobacteraceae bacterium]|nr:hypothetical protein [Steroidobacteraceae bacterium]